MRSIYFKIYFEPKKKFHHSIGNPIEVGGLEKDKIEDLFSKVDSCGKFNRSIAERHDNYAYLEVNGHLTEEDVTRLENALDLKSNTKKA